ncbi:MAG: hydrogenase nickel incorporation protein HypB, partial [Bacteroidales bacterium]|nr:hydrogenase nickel incorporation protein HypB [Bacteroidales bacterium]
IENVGNLVCPAAYDLGEDQKVVIVSTTEGDDKPIKYPMLFREAQVILLNKVDLIEYTNFNKISFNTDLNNVNGKVPFFEISCTGNIGMDQWYDWISSKISSK